MYLHVRIYRNIYICTRAHKNRSFGTEKTNIFLFLSIDSQWMESHKKHRRLKDVF